MEFTVTFTPQEQKLFDLEDRPYTQGELDALQLIADGVSRTLSAKNFDLAQHEDGMSSATEDELDIVKRQQATAIPLINLLGYLADFPQQ